MLYCFYDSTCSLIPQNGRKVMNSEAKKNAIRQSVRESTKLYKNNLIDKDTLFILAASALAWEINSNLDEKVLSKSIQLESKIKKLKNRR